MSFIIPKLETVRLRLFREMIIYHDVSVLNRHSCLVIMCESATLQRSHVTWLDAIFKKHTKTQLQKRKTHFDPFSMRIL